MEKGWAQDIREVDRIWRLTVWRKKAMTKSRLLNSPAGEWCLSTPACSQGGENVFIFVGCEPWGSR